MQGWENVYVLLLSDISGREESVLSKRELAVLSLGSDHRETNLMNDDN